MSDVNSVVVVGRLTKDAEVRYTQSNIAHATVALAVNRSVKHGDKYENEASFFEVELWGKTAENVQKYSGKGKQLAVQGSLAQQRWEKNGQKYSKVVIVASTVQFIGFNNQSGNEAQPQSQSAFTENQNGFSEDIPYPADMMDIPF